MPVLVKDVARVYVGYVPRLGIAGRDHEDDVAASIVVMGRTQHTNDVVPRIKDTVAALNSDGSLPPGVKLVPYYDRTSLVIVTTHTVLHNLIFGCLLVFLIQWIFLGDLRSAIIVAANIPFALFFSIIILVCKARMQTCCRSARLISASSSIRQSFWSRTSSAIFKHAKRTRNPRFSRIYTRERTGSIQRAIGAGQVACA